ncbi:MAG: hypothetical protein Q9180_009623 [Flavoplaca navasiana]
MRPSTPSPRLYIPLAIQLQVGHNKNLVACLAKGSHEAWDLIFSTSEGIHGLAREAQVPALLEAYEIPFVGPDAASTMLCHDKSKAKVECQSELEQTVSLLCAQYPDQDILVESYLAGQEFTVGILGTASRARVIGAFEIRIHGPWEKAEAAQRTKEVEFLTSDLKDT